MRNGALLAHRDGEVKIWGRHPLGSPKKRETQGRIDLYPQFDENVSDPRIVVFSPIKFAG